MPLTDFQIKSLQPQEKEYKVADGRGLFLRVYTSGSKTWLYRYYVDSKSVYRKLGKYPDVSLKRARELLYAFNKDEQEIVKNVVVENVFESLSFKNVCDEWLVKKENTCVPAYLERLRGRLNNFILPVLGNKSINEIKPIEILNITRKIEAEKKFETARRILGICSQIFKFAVACTYCDSDPCRDLDGALTPSKHKPMAAITKPKEVGLLMQNIKNYPVDNMRNALLFSAYTFCRPGEIRQAEWKEVDFEEKVWRIPAEKMKMRAEHVVPLSQQCIKILLEQKGLNNRWVFPSTKPSKALSESGTLSAIRRMGYPKEKMCPHGFRAMASTLLNEKGYNPDVIEKCLAHESKNKIRAIYNRAQYMPERIKLMQEYADYLDELALK